MPSNIPNSPRFRNIPIRTEPGRWRYKGVLLIDEIPYEESLRLVDSIPPFHRKRISHVHRFPETRTLQVVWLEPMPAQKILDSLISTLEWRIEHGEVWVSSLHI